MICLTIQPGGYTPHHDHAWEEEVFVLSGNGEIKTDEAKRAIRSGDAIFVDENTTHQYLNSGSEPLEIICVIPVMQEDRSANRDMD